MKNDMAKSTNIIRLMNGRPFGVDTLVGKIRSECLITLIN
ncbi:hypothetical protein NBRC111894_1758 [Sporolactobacillus inulinus]|uniref:Uncharacterized protein n=1 Tax=Sporolactobacillus inulinus TaxID=2078 RepID=A0A4Y1ZB34_9BACL|nr:hypothetical protein NBRC111894_1758 [Sporolactobacillus inulinus]